MNSRSLKELGFKRIGKWRLENGELEYSIEDGFKEKAGIYAFVLSSPFGRLKGESDILYIGKSDKRFETRFDGYKNPGCTQRTNKRINQKLKNLLEFTPNCEVFIYVCVFEHRWVLNDSERKLLEIYESEHYELPPFNRSG